MGVGLRGWVVFRELNKKERVMPDVLYSPTKGYVFPKSGQRLMFPEQRGAFRKLAELLWDQPEMFAGDMNNPFNEPTDAEGNPIPGWSWNEEKGEWMRGSKSLSGGVV